MLISNKNTPISESVLQKVKSEEENERIANYLNTIEQYGSGKYSKGVKTKKKKTKRRY